MINASTAASRATTAAETSFSAMRIQAVYGPRTQPARDEWPRHPDIVQAMIVPCKSSRRSAGQILPEENHVTRAAFLQPGPHSDHFNGETVETQALLELAIFPRGPDGKGPAGPE